MDQTMAVREFFKVLTFTTHIIYIAECTAIRYSNPDAKLKTINLYSVSTDDCEY